MDAPPSVAELIKAYELQPHPEGGYFRETYRAQGRIPKTALPGFPGAREYSTAIYFLLPAGSKSNLHRIRQDELWHFYLGGPMTVAQMAPDGTASEITLGPDVLRGERLQHVVPAGHWFGAFPRAGTPYSFVGCTVAPAFEFADFELGSRDQLLRNFPNAKPLIERLT